MFKRKSVSIQYDRENQKPVIRSSICNGEQTAGFKDIHTGKFTEVMVIRSARDLEEFLKKYEIDENEIKKEW